MKKLFIALVLATVFGSSTGIGDLQGDTQFMSFAGESPVYHLNPDTKPLNNKYTGSKTYNKYTKQYYMLRTYLEQLEKKGGGTIVLNPGKYTVTNVLFVPANTTFILLDGVTIEKGTSTGTAFITPAKSIFQLVRPSASNVREIYGAHNGEYDINFIGIGNAKIDLKNFDGAIALVMAHNRNVRVEGITFKNYKTGHFVELNASQNVRIINNRFIGSKASSKSMAEAVNIDTPDYNTRGFNSIWSNHDMTPNDDVLIENNIFENVDRAIGTHQYSEGKMHTDIKIINNKISKARRDPIIIMNWKDTVITGNTIEDVPMMYNNGPVYGIYASGAVNPTIRDNVFKSLNIPVLFTPHKNKRTFDTYATTYNNISVKNRDDLMYNKYENTGEAIVQINSSFMDFKNGVEKIYLKK